MEICDDNIKSKQDHRRWWWLWALMMISGSSQLILTFSAIRFRGFFDVHLSNLADDSDHKPQHLKRNKTPPSLSRVMKAFGINYWKGEFLAPAYSFCPRSGFRCVNVTTCCRPQASCSFRSCREWSHRRLEVVSLINRKDKLIFSFVRFLCVLNFFSHIFSPFLAATVKHFSL